MALNALNGEAQLTETGGKNFDMTRETHNILFLLFFFTSLLPFPTLQWSATRAHLMMWFFICFPCRS